jgi:hypothetical protein
MRGSGGKFTLLPILAAAASAFTNAPPALGADDEALTIRGSIGVEARAFTMRPAYAAQDPAPVQASLIASAKASWTSNDKTVVIDVAPFLRLDETDPERTHGDLREAAVNFYGRNVELRLGISKVYWGVTESRRIVDIVNQTDLVEDPDGDDKLGQPMLLLRGRHDDVEATVLVLPLFRPRTFAGPNGRLRPAIPIDTSSELYESPSRAHRLDVAARLKARVDDFDIGVSYFNGTSREPRFALAASGLVPVYDVIDQFGLDVQATLDATLLKLEAITRDGHQGVGARRFSAVVAGVEHTLSQFAGTEWDVGLVLEFAWDDRPASAPPTIFDKDVFFGTRFAFNDEGDSSALLGALVDVDKDSIYATLEASSRIGEALRLELEGAFVLRAGDLDAVLRQFRDDSFVTVRLLYFL